MLVSAELESKAGQRRACLLVVEETGNLLQSVQLRDLRSVCRSDGKVVEEQPLCATPRRNPLAKGDERWTLGQIWRVLLCINTLYLFWGV